VLSQSPPKAPPAFAFSIQGEIGGGKTTRDVATDFNLVYGGILGLHFAGPLGLELEYQHAENDTSGGGATLKQDGVLGHLRFDFLREPVTPFVYVGVGWVHYSANASLLANTEDHVVIPGGVGLEVNVKPIVLGARGEYQWNTDTFAGKYIDYWKVVATVGLRLP
jgi:hypothetical protein